MPAVNNLADVFTPGRAPGVTYNPRVEREFEGVMRKYLHATGSALTVSGPTKAGKTVLVERMLPRTEAIWISGSDISSVDDLWDEIIDFFQLYDEVEVQTQEGRTGGGRIGARLGVPSMGEVSAEASRGQQSGMTVKKSVSRDRARIAQEALRDLSVPIVIDDFHYVSQTARLPLTRVIKSLIQSVHVVLIAVPQDSFNAVRDESDMVGRVWQMEITPWSEEELVYIGERGFTALNLIDRNNTLSIEFARNNLGAPYLMQQLCLDYCLSLDILAPLTIQQVAQTPSHIENFYKNIATRYVPGVFDELRKGPKTKGTPRLARTLKSGEVTGIYGAILYGIAHMGPVRAITTQKLMKKLGEELTYAPPTQNVANALGHMKAIAIKSKGASDPVLDYKNDTLYVDDPFLSFYLRFGEWSLPALPDQAI